MKKVLVLIAALIAVSVSVPAQISTGKNTSKVIRTGNRPEAGDWGIFVGASYSDFANWFDKKVSFEGFPLVNVKYYISDEVEARLGIQLQGQTQTVTGEHTVGEGENEKSYDYKHKLSVGTNLFRPGIAYHFSTDNILDVYVGGELPIG